MKNSVGWEVGKFESMHQFEYSLNSTVPLTKSLLASLSFTKFNDFHIAETFIINQLIHLEILKLPLDDGSEISIQDLYPYNVFVGLGDNKCMIAEKDILEYLSREIENKIVPNRLKTCLNCKFFHFSGMSHDMSGGSMGYCFYGKDHLEDKVRIESTTHIWNWCSQFEG